jgi:type IX secretion system PorP/SprF family membrane protein
MKKFKNIIRAGLFLIIISFTLISGSIYGQDPQLSQFYSAPLYLGPSFAGSEGLPRVGLNFRAQWVQLPHPFLTTSLFADHYIDKYKLGIGLMIMNDDAGGLLNSTYISTQYSYRIGIGKKTFFVPGLQVQYFTKRINTSELLFSDQIFNGEVLPVSIESIDKNKFSHFDFAVSGLVFSERYWIGITGNHLMKLNANLPDKQEYASFLFSAYGGATLNIASRKLLRNNTKTITPAFHYKSQDKLHQLDLGIYMINYPYMLGLWYRGIPVITNTYTRDGITLLAGLQTGMLSIAYSYDFTLSKLISTTGGSHEISLKYKFPPQQSRRKKIGAVPCPHF